VKSSTSAGFQDHGYSPRKRWNRRTNDRRDRTVLVASPRECMEFVHPESIATNISSAGSLVGTAWRCRTGVWSMSTRCVRYNIQYFTTSFRDSVSPSSPPKSAACGKFALRWAPVTRKMHLMQHFGYRFRALERQPERPGLGNQQWTGSGRGRECGRCYSFVPRRILWEKWS